MKLASALSLFIIARQAEGKSPRTVEFYESNIQRYIGYLNECPRAGLSLGGAGNDREVPGA